MKRARCCAGSPTKVSPWHWRDPTTTHRLFLLIGAQPHTEWLPDGVQCDEQGFTLTGDDVDAARWPLTRSRYAEESSMPGVFVVGDVRHGSVKRVASAVGEGSVAIQTLHQFFALEGLEAAGRRTRSSV